MNKKFRKTDHETYSESFINSMEDSLQKGSFMALKACLK